MEKEPIVSPITDVSAQDWQHTPEPVQRFVLSLLARLSTVEHRLAALEEENQLLKEENQLLKERLGGNSSNSSRPPSSDASAQSRKKKEATGKRRGAQPGHPAHQRQLIPVEQCQEVVDHYPQQCRGCGNALSWD